MSWSYVIVSKTIDKFNAAETELFRQLRAQGVPLIVFGNHELEMHGLQLSEADDFPVRFPFTLEDLMRNSDHRYVAEHG